MTTAAREGRAWRPSISIATREAVVVGALVAALLTWLVIQTPVVLLAYQYGGIPTTAARFALLAKDVVVALAIVVLLVRNWNRIELRFYDIAALAYVGLIGVYSVVPWLLGSDLPFMAVAASARVFLMPVELYVLGRLAVLAGVDVGAIVRVFIGASAVAAAFAVGQWMLVPVEFWESTMNMPRFVREVQGLPGALSLWEISILGHYGVGEGGQFPRAIGPFTHPVGASHYFVAPLLLAVSRTMKFDALKERRAFVSWGLLALLFAAAIITPISRGSWIAAGVGVLICGVLLRRARIAITALVLTAIFVVLVPPFSYSVRSAASFEDSSVIAHGQAVEEGVGTVLGNPIGLGVGQADHLGTALAGGADAAGVGENMYLSILVTVGPLGLLAFLVWMAGIGIGLAPRRHRASWMHVALFAALVGYAASALTASPLMRFTTSASFWLLTGLLVGTVPAIARRGKAGGSGGPDTVPEAP